MYNVHLFIINGKQYSINIAKPYNITSNNNDNISEKINCITAEIINIAFIFFLL